MAKEILTTYHVTEMADRVQSQLKQLEIGKSSFTLLHCLFLCLDIVHMHLKAYILCSLHCLVTYSSFYRVEGSWNFSLSTLALLLFPLLCSCLGSHIDDILWGVASDITKRHDLGTYPFFAFSH